MPSPGEKRQRAWPTLRPLRARFARPETPKKRQVANNKKRPSRAFELLLCGLAAHQGDSTSSSPDSADFEPRKRPQIQVKSGPELDEMFQRVVVLADVGEHAGKFSTSASKPTSAELSRSDKSERLSAPNLELGGEGSQVRIVVEHNQRALPTSGFRTDSASSEPTDCNGINRPSRDLLQLLCKPRVQMPAADQFSQQGSPPSSPIVERRKQPSSADSRRIGAQRKAWQLAELLDQYGRRKQAARSVDAAGRLESVELRQASDDDQRSCTSQLPEQVDGRFYLEDHWTQFVSIDCGIQEQLERDNLAGLNLGAQDYLTPGGRNLEGQQDAIWELLTTELAYLKRIRVIMDVFLAALSYLQRQSLLTEIDHHRMSSNISEVYQANRTFWLAHLLPMIRRARSTGSPLDPSQLKEAFLQIKTIFEPYYKYCLEHRGCLCYVKELKKSNDLFKLYVTWCESQKECERLRLTDLLAKPMQRLTRYSLLLRAITKRTDEPRQLAALDQMMSQMSKFVLTVNFELRKKDEMDRILLSTVRNDSSELYLDNENEPQLAYLEVPRYETARPVCRGSDQQLAQSAELGQPSVELRGGAFVTRLRRMFNLDAGATFSSTSPSVSLSSASYEDPAADSGGLGGPPRRLVRSMEASWATIEPADSFYGQSERPAPPPTGYLGFHEKLALHNRRVEEEAAIGRRLQLRRRAGSDRAAPPKPVSPAGRSADRLSASNLRWPSFGQSTGSARAARHSSSSSVSIRAFNLTRSLTGDLVDSFMRVASTRRLSSSSTLARRRKDAASQQANELRK